jgi:3-hexulose-6-phosphate synthase
VLLQIAFDKPEHLAFLSRMQDIADIVEIGTPLLKRFGVGTIATARELCSDTLVLADTKTVDGGQLEADMVFGAGAAMMTVLSCASKATHELVGWRRRGVRASVVVDTITESGKPELLAHEASFRPLLPMSPSIPRRTRAWRATLRLRISRRWPRCSRGVFGCRWRQRYRPRHS